MNEQYCTIGDARGHVYGKVSQCGGPLRRKAKHTHNEETKVSVQYINVYCLRSFHNLLSDPSGDGNKKQRRCKWTHDA